MRRRAESRKEEARGGTMGSPTSLLVVQRLERVQLRRSPRREDRRENPHDDRGDGEDDDLGRREGELEEVDLRDEDARQDQARARSR